jgi:DNA polymerase III subunit delta'
MKETAILAGYNDCVKHPREVAELFGHEEAEDTLLDALNKGRLPHAWLLSGPKGIGKATLAYRFARFLLANGDKNKGTGLFAGDLSNANPESLFVDSKDPVFSRIAAGSHADLKSIERRFDEKKGKFKTEIVVEDMRSIASFFSLSSAEGGWRVIIIDSADEMNSNAANALLKALEEPPAKVILLLVCHNHGRLLPTIRSRCRKLGLSALNEGVVVKLLLNHYPEMLAGDALLLAQLSGGSIGRALDLEAEGGLELYNNLLSLLETLPDTDVAALHVLAGKLGRVGGDMAFHTFGDLLLGWLGRFILHATKAEQGGNSQETLLNKRLSSITPLASWLEVWDKISYLLARTDSINLDRRQIIISIFLLLEKTVQD